MMAAFVSVAAMAQNDPKPAGKGVTYGAGTENKDAITVAAMDEQVQKSGSFNGKITGKVTEVCQEKGCWMKVEKANGETVMVAPAAGFYSTPGVGLNEVRIAYVLKKEDLIRSVAILKEALKVYNA